MHRRKFLSTSSSLAVGSLLPRQLFALTSGLLEADVSCQQKHDTPLPAGVPPDNDDIPLKDYPAYLQRRYKAPALMKLADVNFKPSYELVDYHCCLFVHHNWDDHPYGKMRVQRAIELIGAVWSSAEFRDRLYNAPPLIWRYDPDNPSSPDRTISGKDLYDKHLLANQTPSFRIQMVTDGASISSEAAHSGADSDVINLQYGYASKNATTYDLANTISHEFTHLKVGGASLDSGRTGDSLSLYVSYGIGGLTENLAAGTQLYCFETPVNPLPAAASTS